MIHNWIHIKNTVNFRFGQAVRWPYSSSYLFEPQWSLLEHVSHLAKGNELRLMEIFGEGKRGKSGGETEFKEKKRSKQWNKRQKIKRKDRIREKKREEKRRAEKKRDEERKWDE